MENSLISRIVSKIAVAILVLAVADLVFLNWWVIKSQKSNVKSQSLEETRIVESLSSPSPETQASPSPNLALPSPIVKTETPNQGGSGQASTQTIVQTAQKEIFIPIGSGSTKKNSLEDLAGLEVTIDTGKYSAIEAVVFEASLWVQDGNGRVTAQLFNKSDGHAVWNSEISTTSASGVLTTSSKITLDSGSKTYKVQAKTDLTEFAAHVDNARIKITLK